tara:strand:+ start:63 stop:338 length:276 start_codon:yes stop_codon:yes gene_type:complete
MKVKMFKKEWEVKDINYKERRELWQLSLGSFVNSEVVQDKYFEMINKVEELSGLQEKDYIKKDKSLLTMAEIDLLLQEVFASYMSMEKKDS